MMMKTTISRDPEAPVVGIPCYWHESEDLLGRKASALPDSYVRALEAAASAPMLIPVTPSNRVLASLYGAADGLLLAGGPDVAPSEYGQTDHPALRKVTSERDRVERRLLEWALRDRKPILCICRGIQMLNVVCGGTLWQDIAAQAPGAFKHDMYPDFPPQYLCHEVDIDPETRLSAICKADRIRVNSLHHQAVNRVGRGLRVTARAPDGVVEALEHSGERWLMAVQWHPEWLVEQEETARRLFESFAAACRAYGSLDGRGKSS
ncbi:MAG: gamma-glutamyl-gamma-aminobutyrate hydrolase family protein [Desulfobacterales bacterium]